MRRGSPQVIGLLLFVGAVVMSVLAFTRGAIVAGLAWYVGAGVMPWAASLRGLPSRRPGIYHVLGVTGAPLAWALWPLVLAGPLIQRILPAESETPEEFMERMRREPSPASEDEEDDEFDEDNDEEDEQEEETDEWGRPLDDAPPTP